MIRLTPALNETLVFFLCANKSIFKCKNNFYPHIRYTIFSNNK